MSSYFNFEPTNLIDILHWRARYQADSTAYIFLADGEHQECPITYQALYQRVMSVVTLLREQQAEGERILLLYPPGLDYITAFFGCLAAGAVAVPVYPPHRNRPDPRLEVIATDAQATLALTIQPILAVVEQQLEKLPRLANLRWLATDGLVPLTGSAAMVERPLIGGDTLAFLQYTSGSTGDPKGVMVSHANLLHNSAYIRAAFENDEASVSVTWLPSFHDMGLIDGVIQPLYAGFLGVMMPSVSFLQRPLRWLQAVSRYRATHCGGPNFCYELCIHKVTDEQKQGLDLSSWRSTYNGAEPIHRNTLERFATAFRQCGFRAKSLYPCYGMAETTLMISGGLIDEEPVYYSVQKAALEKGQIVPSSVPEEPAQDLVGCGRLRSGMRAVIVDPETLAQCSPARVGEIWVSSPSVAQGYWQRPDATKETFNAYLADSGEGPFLRTGDLGFLRDGELFITGRLKDVVIIRGRNYYPQDIERTVEQSHTALRPGCGAAFAIEVNGGERLIVVHEVERSHLRRLNRQEVVSAIRRAITVEHNLQVSVIVLLKPGGVLKTSSGKIQRRACRQAFLDGMLPVLED